MEVFSGEEDGYPVAFFSRSDFRRRLGRMTQSVNKPANATPPRITSIPILLENLQDVSVSAGHPANLIVRYFTLSPWHVS